MHRAKTVKFWPPKSNHAFIEIIKINAVTFLTAGHPDLNYFPGTSVAHNPCSFLVFTRSTFNISQRALKLIAGRFLKTRPCLLYIHFFPILCNQQAGRACTYESGINNASLESKYVYCLRVQV